MMLHRHTFTLPVIAALLLACGTRLFAGDEEFNRRTLKGLKSFKVLIEEITPGADRDGLTKDQLQTDVELRLRKAGVNVMPSGSGNATLYVEAELMKLRSINSYVYYCGVAVHQGVLVVENNTSSWQETWSVAKLGAINPGDMRRGIRESIGDLIDKFINAYLSVNPK